MNKIKTLTLAIAAISAANVQAFEFNAGPVEAQLNTTLSYGIAVRTEDRNKGLIHPGTLAEVYGGDKADYYSVGANSYNADDGTLNYEKNDIFTNVVKGSMDLELVWGSSGLFVRGSAFYDYEIMDEDPAYIDYIDETKDAAGSGYDLLDAFVWHNFDIGNVPVSARLGRQVVSWGESTFIQGGINSINPVNASAARKPGVEVKEILLPVNMAYASFGITDDLTLETFYQLEWEKTRPDSCGTFFSTSDIVADGCGPVLLSNTFSQTDYLNQYESGGSVPVTTRTDPDDPSDDGQYGMALRWYSEALGDTEFGLYHMNIHARLPAASIQVLSATGVYDSTYHIEYVEDIQISGLSFSRGTESGWSIGGEVSFKQDFPISWNGNELIAAANNASYGDLTQQAVAASDDGLIFGDSIEGYDKFDVWQAQMTFIKFFDQVLGASRLSFVSEVGATYIVDLGDGVYGRSSAFGFGTSNRTEQECKDLSLTDNDSYCTDEGFVEELSAGIRVKASLDYSNALFGANLQPNASLSYDKGTGLQFEDKRIVTSLGVNFDYLNTYSGGIAYVMYDGSDYDQLDDRDNVSLNVKVSF
ncbi:MAG: DUF1302 domain-containing protein [Bermanella sp.]